MERTRGSSARHRQRWAIFTLEFRAIARIATGNPFVYAGSRLLKPFVALRRSVSPVFSSLCPQSFSRDSRLFFAAPEGARCCKRSASRDKRASMGSRRLKRAKRAKAKEYIKMPVKSTSVVRRRIARFSRRSSLRQRQDERG